MTLGFKGFVMYSVKYGELFILWSALGNIKSVWIKTKSSSVSYNRETLFKQLFLKGSIYAVIQHCLFRLVLKPLWSSNRWFPDLSDFILKNFFSFFNLSLSSLYLFEHCFKLGITISSCVCFSV